MKGKSASYNMIDYGILINEESGDSELCKIDYLTKFVFCFTKMTGLRMIWNDMAVLNTLIL